MPNHTTSAQATAIPEGYSAIPLHESELDGMLRLCILARQTPDPATGHLVLLRDLPDAAVYLGCVADAGGRLREWVEIWVQNVDGLQSSLPGFSESFSNHSLDERWKKTAHTFKQLNPRGFIQTGWENKHALPTFLDLTGHRPVHPSSGDKKWELCQDDAALQAAGLPAYGTSLARYLYVRGGDGGFVPVVSGAPAGAKTKSLEDALKETGAHVPVNPQGGMLMAQSFAPLSYEDYVDLLGGKPWKGFEHGKRALVFNGAYSSLNDWQEIQQSGAHIFLGAQGKAGRFIESFHLKVQLFLDAVASVQAFVEQQQVPFLNLGADSFRVSLDHLGSKLPYLWTAKCHLVKPSQAYALPVETSDFRYFIRVKPGGTSIYQPEGLNAQLQGNGSARIRKVAPEEDRVRIEGTLVMQAGVNVSPNDLLWIRLPLPSGRVDLYGNIYTTDGLAQGEARFRTVPQKLSQDTVNTLKGAEGVSFARSPFEIVPLLSTPCDLHALGVLAVRTFLTNPQYTLAEGVDELLSLARKVAEGHKAETPLADRIGSVMRADTRFSDSLAPHRLVREQMEAKAAYDLLPPELWHRTLAAIVRLFPGVGPDSHSKDYGDAPALALESAFAEPMQEFENLVVRSRSLVVIDWNANREVHSAIRDLMDRG